ncbi:MAG TPA: hypothetical protein VF211_01525 [Burkholderiales bacterium]
MSSALPARPAGTEPLLSAGTTSAAIVVVSLLCFVPLSANDFWLHAAIGRIIRTTGEIPASALFPFTEAADFPFHAHEWLASLVMHLLDDGLGHERVIFAKGLLGLALFGLAYRLSHRLTGSFPLAVPLSVAALIVANFRFRLRPELFALLFALLLLNLLAEYRERRNPWYLVACAAIAVPWANMHGSAPIAVALIGAFAAGAALSPGERVRAAAPYALCAAGVALALLVNPYGVGVYRFAWELQASGYLRSLIYEWMPTFSGPFVGTRGFWAFVVYLALLGALLYAGRRRVSPEGWLLLAGFGALALHTQRHIAFFAIVSLYPASLAARALAPRLETSRRLRVAVLIALMAAGGLLLRFGNLSGGYPYFVESNNFSPLLAGYVDQGGVRGNVLNSYALGAELVYRAWPRARPAIDSRVDIYGERYLLFIERVLRDEALFRDFVRRYDVNYVLLTRPDFEGGLRGMPGLQRDGWRIVFADHKAVLLGRR